MKTLIAFPLLALSLALPACGGMEGDFADEVAFDEGKEDAAKNGRFETFTGRDGRFYFHLLAGNGQKVLQSQGYATEQGAVDGINSVRANGIYPDPYHVLQAQDGQWYFNLYAGNWQVIGTSELYVTKANADRAVATVIKLVAASPAAPAASGARFQVFKGLDSKYYFHLRAQNGEIVVQSQGYSKRASALAGTASVRSNGADAARYQIKLANNGQYYFVIVAVNGQTVGVSETYVSKYNAERGAAAVQTLIQGGTIADAL